MKAMALTEEMHGSQQNFLQILEYGKELYSRGDASLTKHWPTSWQAAIRLLKDRGYSEPQQLYICLDDSHPCTYDVIKSTSETCRYCMKTGSIKYSYLCLGDKVRRWCQDPLFCQKMTEHWNDKQHWLNVQGGWHIKNEIWDGSRFGELSWFWDPSQEWITPVRCPTCKVIVSAETIEEAMSVTLESETVCSVTIECPECFSNFNHNPKVARGDPRNIALIGHWDGWQPFSTSGKHSSGKNYCLCVTGIQPT